jgi:hypothetical protein
VSIITIPGGTFDTDAHIYRDEQDRFVPSITQIIQLCGFTDYDGIPQEVLDNAADRGSRIHAVCWSIARYGDVDLTWLDEEIEPYIAAYRKAISELNFTVDKEWVESPVIATVGGMKFACTPDVIGTRHPWPWVIELKTTAKESKAWAIQTVAQAIARFGCLAESAKRMAIMLRKDGTYRCCVHDNHSYDRSVFLAALTCVYWRINDGQKLAEVV